MSKHYVIIQKETMTNAGGYWTGIKYIFQGSLYGVFEQSADNAKNKLFLENSHPSAMKVIEVIINDYI